MTKKVILDCDTGSDDAIAIQLALLSDELDVLGICTVGGNTAVENTTENTLRVLAAMGKSVPVYKGCDVALTKRLYPERDVACFVGATIDGEVVKMHDDLFDLPASEQKAESLPAPFFYHDTLLVSEEPVHIITTGPMTNLALAISLWPELKDHIASLTVMGGGYHVYNTRYAEGNFWYDPEAVEIILQAGLHPTIVPLDATHTAIITNDEIEEVRAHGGFSCTFSADLMHQRMILHTVTQPLFLPDSATVHDVVAVAACLDPEVLKDVREVSLHITTTGIAEGHCAIDRTEMPEKANCRFAFSANRERFVSLFLEKFTGRPQEGRR